MANFEKLFNQTMQNDPLHIEVGYQEKFKHESSVYPIFPKYSNEKKVQLYVNQLTTFHCELAREEMLLQTKKYNELIQKIYMGNWAHEKISNLKIDEIERYIRIWKLLREIEYGVPIGSIQLSGKEPIHLSEREEYKKARESYQTALNIIFTQIEIGRIIPDDTQK